MSERKPFIPRALDDFGFTPAEFRIVCRISRRGDCWESIPKIAKGCKLSVKTVKAVIPALINWGVLVKVPRPGRTSILRLAPSRQWQRPRAKETPGSWGKADPGYPAQSAPHEGSPSKGGPTKGSLGPDAVTRVKGSKGSPLPGEKAYVKALEAGAPEEHLDKLAEPLRTSDAPKDPNYAVSHPAPVAFSGPPVAESGTETT